MRTLKTLQMRPLSTPFAFETFFDGFERLFEGRVPTPAPQELSFQPHYEVIRDEDGYLLSFDLPGVAKEDVKIELKDRELKISGERKSLLSEEKRGHTDHRYGHRYGRFENLFVISEEIDLERIEAHQENGVLRLMLPFRSAKKQAEQVKTIAIESGPNRSFLGRLMGSGTEAKKDTDAH